MSQRLPVVAVVGRPNVGKSTFFNRVLGRRQAIVDDRPGVTRDRNFARADWAGRHFFVVDTGGVVEGSDNEMDRAIRRQALAAVEECDAILLLVDGKEGVQTLDERLAQVLRKSGKPVLLGVNKVDNLPHDTRYLDFWSLGMGEPMPVSAISGKGSGDLLDRLLELLPSAPDSANAPDEIRVAVVGKPNVGKSSLVNRLLHQDRVVVSDQAGTTRDPVDTPLQYHGRTLVLVDTAGLRRQSRISDELEYYSALRTERVVLDSDVCVALVDASEEELHAQDIRIIQTAWDAGKAVILLANKWDLVEKETMTAVEWTARARARVPFLNWVPVVFVSALSGQRVRKVLDLILEVQEERYRRIDTHEVNEVLRHLVGRQPPPHHRGAAVKIRYGTQVDVAPPTFALFSNFPKSVPAHYVRYLHNGFRNAWSFMGTPIRLKLRSSKDDS